MRSETEHSTCPTCGRPTFRYVTVYPARLSPAEPTTVTTWWFHHGLDTRGNLTFACDQRDADG